MLSDFWCGQSFATYARVIKVTVFVFPTRFRPIGIMSAKKEHKLYHCHKKICIVNDVCLVKKKKIYLHDMLNVSNTYFD